MLNLLSHLNCPHSCRRYEWRTFLFASQFLWWPPFKFFLPLCKLADWVAAALKLVKGFFALCCLSRGLFCSHQLWDRQFWIVDVAGCEAITFPRIRHLIMGLLIFVLCVGFLKIIQQNRSVLILKPPGNHRPSSPSYVPKMFFDVVNFLHCSYRGFISSAWKRVLKEGCCITYINSVCPKNMRAGPAKTKYWCFRWLVWVPSLAVT